MNKIAQYRLIEKVAFFQYVVPASAALHGAGAELIGNTGRAEGTAKATAFGAGLGGTMAGLSEYGHVKNILKSAPKKIVKNTSIGKIVARAVGKGAIGGGIVIGLPYLAGRGIGALRKRQVKAQGRGLSPKMQVFNDAYNESIRTGGKLSPEHQAIADKMFGPIPKVLKKRMQKTEQKRYNRLHKK